MIVDDQEFKKFSESRARLAYCCGTLHGTLEALRRLLLIDNIEILQGSMKAQLSDSIHDALDEVSEILQSEFYPDFSSPPAPPKPPAQPSKP